MLDFDLSTDFPTNYAPNFIQNTDNLILLGIRVPKAKDLSAQSLKAISITSKVGFQTMFISTLFN